MSKHPNKRFLVYALLLSGLFLIVHLLGWREYTNILSGTGQITVWQMFCGVIYTLLYVCFVGIVPILVIAAGLLDGGAIIRKYWGAGGK
jgi:hypothetical protein